MRVESLKWGNEAWDNTIKAGSNILEFINEIQIVTESKEDFFQRHLIDMSDDGDGIDEHKEEGARVFQHEMHLNNISTLDRNHQDPYRNENILSCLKKLNDENHWESYQLYRKVESDDTEEAIKDNFDLDTSVKNGNTLEIKYSDPVCRRSRNLLFGIKLQRRSKICSVSR